MWRNVQRARLECGRSCIKSPGRVKPKTIQLECVASPQSAQYYGEGKTLVGSESDVSEWSDMSTCCFSEIAL